MVGRNVALVSATMNRFVKRFPQEEKEDSQPFYSGEVDVKGPHRHRVGVVGEPLKLGLCLEVGRTSIR